MAPLCMQLLVQLLVQLVPPINTPAVVVDVEQALDLKELRAQPAKSVTVRPRPRRGARVGRPAW